MEVNKITRNGKRGYNSKYKKGSYGNNHNFNSKPHYYKRSQENKTGESWEQKERDSKIILLHKSSNFVLAKFSDSFFKQFDLAMKLRKEELRKEDKVNTEVSEITEGDVVEADRYHVP